MIASGSHRRKFYEFASYDLTSFACRTRFIASPTPQLQSACTSRCNRPASFFLMSKAITARFPPFRNVKYTPVRSFSPRLFHEPPPLFLSIDQTLLAGVLIQPLSPAFLPSSVPDPGAFYSLFSSPPRPRQPAPSLVRCCAPFLALAQVCRITFSHFSVSTLSRTFFCPCAICVFAHPPNAVMLLIAVVCP